MATQEEIKNTKNDEQFISRMKICANAAGNFAALARKTGFSQSGIRKYAFGVEPTRLVLIKIAEASGVNLLWLANGTGPVCNLESALMLTAKQELVKNFNYAHQHELSNQSKNEAANSFCDQYDAAYVSPKLPVFVKEVIPKLGMDELLDWKDGNFNTHPKCWRSEWKDRINPVGEDWIQAPTDLVVSVVRELPNVFGKNYLTLNRQKEKYVLKKVLDFLKPLPKDMMAAIEPSFLNRYIQFVSQIYDQEEQSSE